MSDTTTVVVEQVFEEIMSLEMQEDLASMRYSFGYYDARDDAAEIAVRAVADAVAAEREACAELCEAFRELSKSASVRKALKMAEDAIRARGSK